MPQRCCPRHKGRRDDCMDCLRTPTHDWPPAPDDRNLDWEKLKAISSEVTLEEAHELEIKADSFFHHRAFGYSEQSLMAQEACKVLRALRSMMRLVEHLAAKEPRKTRELVESTKNT